MATTERDAIDEVTKRFGIEPVNRSYKVVVTKIAEAYSDGTGSTVGPAVASAVIPKRPPPPRETPSQEGGR